MTLLAKIRAAFPSAPLRSRGSVAAAAAILPILLVATAAIWLSGSRNPLAYANFVRESMRTFALDEVQRRNGLEVKDALIAIGDAVLAPAKKE